MAGKGWNIFWSLAKGCQLDMYDLQPIVQIFPKSTFRYPRGKVSIDRRD
jgi:hypothetical protein